MENPEEIAGNKMLELLEQIKNDRITLRVIILGTGNEGLSIVLGTEIIDDKPCLILDFPTGIGGIIFHAQGLKAIIEFTDRNKIRYTLRSVIEGVTRQYVYILLPNVIHRIQRRRFFRIPAPIDTKVIINEKDMRYEFNVIDISEGGALLSHPASFHNDDQFFKGALKPLIIHYREDDNNMQTIKIDKAEIKRIEKAWETGTYNYAFQFIECGKKEENDIRNLVYSCQRRIFKLRQLKEEEE